MEVDEKPISQTVSFQDVLPLPYKIIFLVNLGVWLWLINNKVCQRYKINLLRVLNLSELNYSNTQLYKDTYRTGVKASVLSVASYLLFHLLKSNSPGSVNIVDYLPLVTIVVLLGQLVWDSGSPSKQRLVQTMKRIVVGGIDSNIRNNDILLSDTLTSYSKVINDLGIYFSFLFFKGEVNLGVELVLLSYPTLVRMRQCFIEYKRSGFRNKQHLLNFFKYTTALVPLIINTVSKQTESQTSSFYIASWLFFSFINSSYSFIWDVVCDWDFNLFNHLMKANDNGALRPNLIFKPVNSYYFAIVIDLVLRFIWIFKVFPDSNITNVLYFSEFGLFTLEVLEILRRWVWVFIKVEIEYIKISDLKDIELNELPH